MTNIDADPTLLFGRIVTATDVRDRVRDTIDQWATTYLPEVARQQGRTVTPPGFRSYVYAVDLDTMPEDQLPVCVVIVPAMAAPPSKTGDGIYRGQWTVGIGVVVSSTTRDDTAALCATYTAAVRTILAQHGSLGGWADKWEWVDERYDELASATGRTVAAGQVVGVVYVDDITDGHAGPTVPAPTAAGYAPPDPGPRPTVVVADIAVVPWET